MRARLPIRIALAALSSPAALFLFVQVQQHLLRHRAERLHAEILALQLHPGTFADIQQLQREWGKWGGYEGECTPHHCIYEITLGELTSSFRGIYAPSKDTAVQEWLINFLSKPLPFRLYRILGGRPASVSANLRVRDDRMWGADYILRVFAYPGAGREYPEAGRNEGQPYFVGVFLGSGPRLRTGLPGQPGSLKRGWKAVHVLNCLGCESVYAHVTPDAPPQRIEQFNRIDFTCITRLRSCMHPAQLAPDLWAHSVREFAAIEPEEADPAHCGVPTETLAREVNDIVLVKVLAVHPGSPEAYGTSASVSILATLKNARRTAVGSIQDFVVRPNALRGSASGTGLQPGKQYVLLYDEPRPKGIFEPRVVEACYGVNATLESLKAVKLGVSQDPSTGEPYDYINPQ